MASTFTIIDGYNFLHSLGARRSLKGPGNLQRARDALAGKIASLMNHDQCARTTIVFDANAESGSLPDASQTHGITILFARDFDDADSMIEHLLRRHSNPKSVVVVSNDRRVQQSARRRRATAVRCESWFEELEQSAGRSLPQSEEGERSDIVSPEERERWMRIFSSRPPRDEQDSSN